MRLFKNILAVALVSLTLFSCSSKSCEAKKASDVAVVKADVTPNQNTKLAISGMVCEMGCAGLIEKELNAMEGVAIAEVIYKDSVANISFDNAVVSENDILALVNSIANHQYKATVLNETATE